MTRLWGKLWVRILAAVIVGPVVMTLAASCTILIYDIVMDGGVSTFSDFLPPVNIMPFVIAAEWVLMLPVFIASEATRRKRPPLPPGLMVIYVALLSVLIVLCLTAAMEIDERIHITGNVLAGVTVVVACYVIPAAVSFAVLSPFIQRWRQRSATVAEIAEKF